jgi:hypothetical protein
MRTTTNAKARRTQRAPEDPSSRRPVPGPDAAVSAGRAVREAHENTDPAAALEGVEATNLHTPGRSRVTHQHNPHEPVPDRSVGRAGTA